MKKTVMIVAAGLFLATGLKAQTLQEGINHLYADRFKSAISVFEKLLAANPNNTDASYWLGQTYLDEDRNDQARQLYDKALATSNNAPILLVGRGHLDLLDKKIPDARQKFETAITMTRGRKGDDPVILNAVGRAIVDARDTSLLSYAVEKLEAAAARDEKNPDIFLNLGNAYRKARPGEGGGQAYTNYKKALDLNPNFAVAYLRLAKLFEAQKNWDLYLENLNKAASVDPKFAPAYYELFYYSFYRQKFEEAEVQLKKYIDSRLPDTYIEDQRMYAELCWGRKDFNCAISKVESVISAMGDQAKPKALKLAADAYFQKGDYANAKKYIDRYFAKEKPEDYIGFDYVLKAKIYAKTPGQEDVVLSSYLEGVKVDTVLDNKLEVLKEGAAFFKANNQRDKEAVLMMKLLELKPKPIINDYDAATRAFYFGKIYDKARQVALQMAEKFPNEIFGYEWAFNSAKLLDTLKKDSIAVPDALKLFSMSEKDTTKFRRQYISAASYLAVYYANDAKDKEKAIEYLKKWQSLDTANAMNIQKNIDILQKSPGTRPQANPKGTAAPAKQGANKPGPTVKPKTSAGSPVVKK